MKLSKAVNFFLNYSLGRDILVIITGRKGLPGVGGPISALEDALGAYQSNR